MDIFAIRRDGYKFQELDLEINDIIDNFPAAIDYGQAHDFSLENISMKDFWKPVRTGFSEIEGCDNLMPDITTWIDATLVLSPKAYRYLGEVLAPYGEFLPVLIGDETFQIFNCLFIADAEETLSNEDNLIFDLNSIENTLVFKSPVQRCMDVFCTRKFKDLVEDFKLNGLVFDTNLASPYVDR